MLKGCKSRAGRLIGSRRIRSLVKAQIAIFTTIAFTFTSVGAQAYDREPSEKSGLAMAAKPTVQAASTAMMQMPLVAPLFIVNQEFTSTLVLVNGTRISTYADLSLRAPDGGEIVHQRISFSPLSRQQVDVGALLASAVSAHTYGSIVVNSAIPGSVIAAALSVTYVGGSEPNYVDEELAMPTPEGSQTLRAVADPGQGSPLIAVSSLSQSEQHLKINCLDTANRPFSKTIELPAQQTVLTEGCTGRTLQDGDIHEFLAAEQNNSNPATGISLTSDAMPGSYAAFALRAHQLKDGKYFSSVAFADPKMLMSSNSVFVGVPVGLTTLLPGGEYIPEVSLANFSNRNANVTVRYAVTSSGKADVNDVKSLLLPAGTSSTIRLENLPGNADLKNSFVVVSDGAPGDVMSKLVSKSETAIREVELLSKDGSDPQNGGNHPWSLEQQSESTLVLFNPSQKPQKFTVAIQGDTGFWQKAFYLESMQTEAISIRGLIQGQVKDDQGLTLPKNLQSGQVSWRSPLNGKGRILESNQRLEMARSFSCGERFVLCSNLISSNIGGNVADGATNVPLGTVTPFVCMDNFGCTANNMGAGDNGFSYYWDSLNTSVITIAGSQWQGSDDQVTVNGVGIGSATVTVQISDYYGCSNRAQGTGNVTPKLTSISPAQGPVGVTIPVTLSGKGLSGATINAGSGIAVTINSSSDTQIKASFAISASAPAGNHAVSVTVGGQLSGTVNFFVQIPTFFMPTNSATALNTFCPAGHTAFYAYVDYQVGDQIMHPILVQGLTPQESVSLNGGSFSSFVSFATPVSTTTSGTFEDIPLGTCFAATPPPNLCANVAQKFQLLVPGVPNPYPITTTVSRRDCEQGIKIQISPVPPGTNYQFGTVN